MVHFIRRIYICICSILYEFFLEVFFTHLLAWSNVSLNVEKLRLNDFVLKSEKDQNGEVKQYYVNETHTSARANVKIFFRGIMKVKV